MFQFAWPYLFLLLPLPWLIWRLRPEPRNQGAIYVPYLADAGQAPVESSGRTSRTRLLFLGMLWLLLLVAGARPQWLGDLTSIPSSGRNLMLAVDVSGSMKATDLDAGGSGVTRLDVVKTLGADFLGRRTGDRVGLILFGTNAYLQAPISFDRTTVSTLLDEAVIGIAGERTAIGDAIGLAIKRLRQNQVELKVLVLMTDGANTAGNVQPADAARMAAAEGLRIHTIGIGADRMLVRGLLGTRAVNPSAELDEALLKKIAESTGGQYFRAKSARDIDRIYAILDQVEPVPQADRSVREVSEFFHWPLALLGMLGGIWLLLSQPGVRGMLEQVHRKPGATA